jgi:translation initiation factor 4G
MESEEARHKRLSEEQERSREKERAKQEAEDKMNREREEKERMEKEEELRRRKEEGEKEKERNRKEEEERERIRKEEREEQDRRRQEAEKERLALEEAERRKKEELEKEEERFRKEEKEKERLLREEAERERIRKEEEATVAAAASAAVDEAAPELDEVEEVDGEVEVEDEVEETATKPKERDLRIDTTTTTSAPLTSESRRRPGPLDLSYASKANVAAPLPSALATARIIDDLGRVPYPEGVRSPQIELNINAKDGKFRFVFHIRKSANCRHIISSTRYDRDFLLQFMSICKEKPDMLPPLDAIGLEPSDQALSRGGSGRHRQSSTSGGQPQPSARQPPVGLGFNAPSFAKSGAPNPFNMGNMGNFATMGTKLSSEERFAIANNGRSASVGGSAGLPFGRPAAPMVRTTSQGGPGGTPGSMPSNRTRSKRGVPRDNTNKVLGGSGGGSSQQGHGSTSGSSGFSGPLGPGSMLDPVVPLEQSANRWVPTSTSRKPTGIDPDSPEIVDRKVKGLLNKLTMEKFDPISDQIIAWANRSEKEKDGRTLIQVIRLVFEKATDEATWSEMYARLCRKMMEQISSKVQDDGIKNSEGKPIAGGQLFRKYLLNRCQEDFERGWVAKEATAAAAATKAMEDQAAKAANDKSTEDNTGDEVELYSEEYYAAQKAKRQGLGLIKFIGELFKLQMLTERIMHECVKKLLGNVKNPEEEEIESLCKLLSTVGAILDTNKARAHMDVYFSRMKELIKSPNVSSRMQFMLQVCIVTLCFLFV